jgi:GH35 family endo-1,4-beta-xylanase
MRVLLPLLALAVTTLVDPARGDDFDPFVTAPARIEKVRKADATIEVRNASGQPVPGATVEVEQTRHAFLFGSNIFEWGKQETPELEKAYRDQFVEVFNFATLPFYWWSYEPAAGTPMHANREEIAAWCREQGITPKGHPLAWNFVDPRWLPSDPDEVFRLQVDRVGDTARRFVGQVMTWDVVNEAVGWDRDDCRRQSPRLTAMVEHVGRDAYVLACLKRAREASPDATLLVNDYVTDQKYVDLLKALIEKSGGKPPFDVVGIQSHMHAGPWPDRQLWDTCERFAPFGLPIHFTESTIVSGPFQWAPRGQREKTWPSTPDGEAKQADAVERFYTILFSHPAVAAITWWDFADHHAWMNAPAGFLREDLSPKPSYERLKGLIKDKWWTRATVTADASGKATVRAFHGTHRVTARDASGRAVSGEMAVAKDGPNRLVLTLP